MPSSAMYTGTATSKPHASRRLSLDHLLSTCPPASVDGDFPIKNSLGRICLEHQQGLSHRHIPPYLHSILPPSILNNAALSVPPPRRRPSSCSAQSSSQSCQLRRRVVRESARAQLSIDWRLTHFGKRHKKDVPSAPAVDPFRANRPPNSSPPTEASYRKPPSPLACDVVSRPRARSSSTPHHPSRLESAKQRAKVVWNARRKHSNASLLPNIKTTTTTATAATATAASCLDSRESTSTRTFF